MTDVGCLRCAELERGFRDPASVNPGAHLYNWARHHLLVHQATPEPREGCAECERYAEVPWGINPRLWQSWARTHYMSCVLAPGYAAAHRSE